jgi:hypothetical protein
MSCPPPKGRLHAGRIWWIVSSDWNNMAQECWTFTIGDYPVIHKSLDYRHTKEPKRRLRSEEISYLSELIQYIATIPELDPVHDANYQANKGITLNSLV